MLDPRIYRTGLVAVVLAVIVFAFTLQGQPGPLTTTLAPDAFNGLNAYQNTLSLALKYPQRTTGSADELAVGNVIGHRLRVDGYGVQRQWFTAATPSGPKRTFNLIGVQQGLQNSAIVIVAHRDSLHSPAIAEQSGTGVLLELARVLGGETVAHTVVIVSTSASTGAAGAAQIAAGLGRPIDTVLVLGDMGGVDMQRPLVVPWSGTSQLAPPLLRATVATSLQSQAGVAAGDPSLIGQLAHLAFPLALTEQAPFNARGIPSVLVSASAGQPVPPEESISLPNVTRLGRATLNAVNAIDGRQSIPSPSAYLSFAGKLVPTWVIALLGLALIVPALATVIDGFARARRRGYAVGRRMVWVGVCMLPFIVVLGIARALGATGLIQAPPGAVGPGTFPLDAGGIAALVCLALLVVAFFVWVYLAGGFRALVGRSARIKSPRRDGAELHAGGKARREPLGDPGAVAAVLIVANVLALVIWAFNPFAALLVAPTLHLWMAGLAPAARIGRALRLVLFALGFALPLLVIAYYMVSLGYGPLALIWTGLMMVSSGQLGIGAGLLICLLLGLAVSAVANVVAIARVPLDRTRPPSPVTVRGPVSYAGPGSLGGTASALPRPGQTVRR